MTIVNECKQFGLFSNEHTDDNYEDVDEDIDDADEKVDARK